MTALADAETVAFLGTADPAASRAFYEQKLGFEFVADEPHALVFRTENAELRIAKAETVEPAAYTVLGWAVPDIDAAVADLEAAGVAFRHYDGIEQDDAGVATFPDGTRVAWFDDPDGNVLSVTEYPTTD